MNKITITIDKKIYKKLAQLKLDRDLKTFDEVLSFILNNQKSKSELVSSQSKHFTHSEKKDG